MGQSAVLPRKHVGKIHRLKAVMGSLHVEGAAATLAVAAYERRGCVAKARALSRRSHTDLTRK